MKYSIEYNGGAFYETLEINGNTAQKIWRREEGGDISGLCSKDDEFTDQFDGLENKQTLDKIYEVFDESMLIADIEDLVNDYDAR